MRGARSRPSRPQPRRSAGDARVASRSSAETVRAALAKATPQVLTSRERRITISSQPITSHAGERRAGCAVLAGADDRSRRGSDVHRAAHRAVRGRDVGLADPTALRVAIDARDAYHFLGLPKGSSPSPKLRCIWRRRPSRTRSIAPGVLRWSWLARRRRSRCRCTCAMLPRRS